MKVKDVELTFSIVEGEDEEKFLAKAIEDMKQRRSRFSKGGRGGKFNNKRRHEGGNNRNSKRQRNDGD